MSTIAQRWQGASITGSDSSQISIDYIITDEADEYIAQADLDTATPTTLGSLVKKSVSLTGRAGPSAWYGQVQWGKFAVKEDGDSSFQFDTGGGSAVVQSSLTTISSTAASGTAPDFENAINVTDDGVEGSTIVAPKYSFSETHFFDVAFITPAYKSTVFSLTGAINDDTFKGFDAGEVMFLGASGALRDSNLWEISYKFEARPNQTSIAIGPTIVVPAKKGFELLWIRYRDEEDATAGHLTKRPIAAYVEQISPDGDMSLLGL